jgi:hypothetical protein
MAGTSAALTAALSNIYAARLMLVNNNTHINMVQYVLMHLTNSKLGKYGVSYGKKECIENDVQYGNVFPFFRAKSCFIPCVWQNRAKSNRANVIWLETK